ncbi:MAG TPA: hypothetical protein VN376_06120 [Longilinea sp.]|nr:hypothetical protein [Longilinea sp.]
MIKSGKEEWQDKLISGLCPALFLLILKFTFDLLDLYIGHSSGNPGLLILALAVLAITAVLFEQSMSNRIVENRRVWMGLAGGLLAWTITEMASRLNDMAVVSETGIILFILVLMIVGTLWRRALPIGARRFMLIFFMAWVSQLFLAAKLMASGWSDIFMLIFTAVGVIAILAVFFLILWVFFRSHTTRQRMVASAWIWFSLTIFIFAFWGSIV